MGNLTGETVDKLLQVLASLPPLQKQPIVNDLTETCACGKQVSVTALEELDTGVFKTLNDVCKDCPTGKKLDKEMARLVCAGCKRVITRIKPATDKTGFKFLPGKTYHLSNCAFCNPGLGKYQIVEKVLWDMDNHVKK